MELLGENLSELRRRQADGRFSLGTTLRLGIQMLRSIEAVHELGYLHRDIKPSNFAMGLTTLKKRVAFIIDFGLARKYVLPTGEVRPARDSTGFRGTARYASINSHLSRDLGRRDDLWSLFYVLIEFLKGNLPWRKIKDKDQIGELKIQCNNPDLVSDLPAEFLLFMEHLQTLRYLDKPDYNYLYNLLFDLSCRINVDDNTPFDWELPVNNSIISTTKLQNSNNNNNNLSKQNSNSNLNLSYHSNDDKKEDLSSSGIPDIPITSSNSGKDKLITKDSPRLLSKNSNNNNNNNSNNNKSNGKVTQITEININNHHGLSVSYVSSHMDHLSNNNINNINSIQHRRCASLPINFSINNNNNNNNNSNNNNNNNGTIETLQPYTMNNKIKNRNGNTITVPISSSMPIQLNRTKSLFFDTKDVKKQNVPILLDTFKKQVGH